MNITVSSVVQQVNNLRQDQLDFEKDMKAKEKVKKEEENLKKVVLEAGEAAQGKTPPKNAMMAYVEALNGVMQQNQIVEGLNAQKLLNNDPIEQNIDEQLKQVSKEQDALTRLSPSDAQQQGLVLNGTMTALDQNLAVLGVNSKQQAMGIEMLSTEDNTAGGQGEQALELIAKLNRMMH